MSGGDGKMAVPSFGPAVVDRVTGLPKAPAALVLLGEQRTGRYRQAMADDGKMARERREGDGDGR